MRGTILAGVVVTLVLAAPASGATLKPWDGTNPFVCTMQYAGEGTSFTNPKADPFCVDYDKTHQDVTELGLVTFLTKEPARMATALNKCLVLPAGPLDRPDHRRRRLHRDLPLGRPLLLRQALG